MAKSIVNKTVSLNEKEEITYGELMMTCVKAQAVINGVPQGFTYDNLKSIGRVDDIISKDKTKPKFTFEDSDYEFIKKKVQSMKWGYYSRVLIEFSNDIINVK